MTGKIIGKIYIMIHLYEVFMAFLAGLFLICPAGVYAQRAIRPAWVTKAVTPKMPSRWVWQNPVRSWKYITRPVESTAYFPFASVPNQAVWDIPLQLVLERQLAAKQRFPVKLLAGRNFPDKKEIDAVIFDLDGTLLDSLSAWEHSGSNFVRSQGFEPPENLDDQLVAMSLMDGANLIKQMYHLSYTPEEILEKTLLPIKNHYYTDIVPMPGIPETLARLHAQGIKMAVATASDRELAEKSLARLGLLSYFDFIITCDEVGVGKSSPVVYEKALERLGTDKSRTLVAEDALHALQTAHKAGFPTAAIEEAHSVAQRAEKAQVATYYVWTFRDGQIFAK